MTKEMNNSTDKQSSDTGAPTLEALARRRLLLSGLGKGSVVLAAAAMPMHSLANSSTRCKTDGIKGAPVWATCSGWHSAVGSRIPADTPVSQGHSCTHYLDKTCWPGYNADPKKDTSCVNKRHMDVFGGRDTRTCYDIVKNAPNTDPCHWVVAHQNAQTCVSLNYPYNKDEIVAYYRNAGFNGYPSRADCVGLFKTHLSNCA